MVFIHGLGGDAFGTWDAGPPGERYWPRWLAEDLKDVNVWTADYEASASSWIGSAMALPDRAANLLYWLEAERLHERPIVFVTHSLGGLVVKQALRMAADRPGTVAARLLDATRGIAFLATPNTGSDLATWMDRLRGLMGSSPAVQDLKADSAFLRDLNGWYRERGPAADIANLVFAETRSTKGITVVEQASADPGIPGVLPVPVDADHIAIAKPASRDELVYKLVLQFALDRLPAPQPQAVISKPMRRLFISYSHKAKSDIDLAAALFRRLEAAGYEVFIDQAITIGTDWAAEIERRIDWCDALLVLLSAQSVTSEMMRQEVRLAHDRQREDVNQRSCRFGWPLKDLLAICWAPLLKDCIMPSGGARKTRRSLWPVLARRWTAVLACRNQSRHWERVSSPI
jgi:hypothetical protein